MDLKEKIRLFEEKNTYLKDLKKKENKEAEFAGIKFHKDMNIGDLKNDGLLLGHAYLHKSYTLKEPHLNKGLIKILHDKFIDIMIKRKMKHSHFDILDKEVINE